MTTRLILQGVHESRTVIGSCLSFSLVRERYSPCAVLNATVRLVSETEPPVSVEFALDGETVFAGLVQSARVYTESGMHFLRIHADSYEIALLRTQPLPGILTEVTLTSLLAPYNLPHITAQGSLPPMNYILVREHGTLREAVTAYAFKLCRGFPFTRADGTVCVQAPETRREVLVPEDAILETGTGNNLSQMISRAEMADIDGTPAAFVMDNPRAAERGIVAVKQFAFDRQFTYSPMEALRFRLMCGNRSMTQRTLRYAGYCGEDLGDTVTAAGVTAEPGRIVIRGSAGGTVTEDTFYYDDFSNGSG